MSDTPRTDAVAFEPSRLRIQIGGPSEVVSAELARQLERELAQAKGQLAAREAKLEVLYKFSADDVLYNFDNPVPNSWYKHTNKVYGEVLREILAADQHSILREHEAKVLEEAASHFDGGVWNLIDGGEFISRENPVKQLRRMAQERRKHGS